MASGKFSGLGSGMILVGAGLLYLSLKNLPVGKTAFQVLKRQPIDKGTSGQDAPADGGLGEQGDYQPKTIIPAGGSTTPTLTPATYTPPTTVELSDFERAVGSLFT